MKKQETIVRKSFAELENQPIKSDVSREFTEEDINRMALEDETDDSDFSQAHFMGIADLENLVNVKQRKQAISIRLNQDVLDWYKSYGPGYQTFIGELLAAYMKTKKEPPKRHKKKASKGKDATL